MKCQDGATESKSYIFILKSTCIKIQLSCIKKVGTINKLKKYFKIFLFILKEKNNPIRNTIVSKFDEFLITDNFREEILQGYFVNRPFNGQKIRLEIVEIIIKKFKPKKIIETGTWIGNTLEYFLKNEIPTFTAEIEKKYYYFSKARFSENSFLNIFNCNSVEMLEKMNNYTEPVFAYLDAHWYSDLPLNEELSHLALFDEVTVLIDDFKVPNNPKWKYDSYKNTDLTLNAISIPKDFSIFFPNYEPDLDGGSKTGCVFLAKGSRAKSVLAEISYLTKHNY